MFPIISALRAFVAGLCRSRASLGLEYLALRHQLGVYKQTVYRPRLRWTDRVFWGWRSRFWRGWPDALVFVQPRTVIAWPQQRFRDHWRRLREQGTPGRPVVAQEVRALSQAMTCNVRFVLLIVAHHRRQVLHVAITEHPTAAWTVQHVGDAFLWNHAPRYLPCKAWRGRQRRRVDAVGGFSLWGLCGCLMQELFRGIAAEGRGPVPSDTGGPQVLQYCASRLSRKHPGLPPTVLAFTILYTRNIS
jgi:hypothetical protein